MSDILITGARLHNLKNIDVKIPRNKLIAVTGISGSGKSSLIFDILFEECRKEYLLSLGIWSGIDDEKKYDNIEGLSPAIAVQQNLIRQSNPRSTVGTRSGILNRLALLFSAEGLMACSNCGTVLDHDLVCHSCGRISERLPAAYFSHNSPEGMCLKCSGRGAYFEVNIDKIAPDDAITLEQVFTRAGITPGYANLLRKEYGEHYRKPFKTLPTEVQEEAIYGHYVNSNSDKKSYCLTRLFQSRLSRNIADPEEYYSLKNCTVCHGFRTGEEARRVFLNGRHIGELGLMTISELDNYLEILAGQNSFSAFGVNLLKEIRRKTRSLVRSRLGHLTLYREMPTLSGGEIQRLFLNSHLDSRMESLIYILDEPTVGLHESEKAELLTSLRALCDLGNTLIVVEHDRNTIELADYVIDIGPLAGSAGGRLIYQGDLAGLLHCRESITGQYLSGKVSLPVRSLNSNLTARKELPADWPCLTIRQAATHNLKDVTIDIPLGVMVGIAGISGSGKSSLISDTLVPLLKKVFYNQAANDSECED